MLLFAAIRFFSANPKLVNSIENAIFFVVVMLIVTTLHIPRLIGISALVCLAVYIFYMGMEMKELRHQLGLCLGLGVSIFLSSDLRNMHRKVTIQSDCIMSEKEFSWWWFDKVKVRLSEIRSIQLAHPEAWGRSYAGMQIETRDRIYLYAVPETVSLEKLAETLTQVGITVKFQDSGIPDAELEVQQLEGES